MKSWKAEAHVHMTANYHTHTVRCGHAEGTEREYIEQALARGLEELGFSDHSPQVFDGGYVSSFRMLPEQLEDYVAVADDKTLYMDLYTPGTVRSSGYTVNSTVAVPGSWSM